MYLWWRNIFFKCRIGDPLYASMCIYFLKCKCFLIFFLNQTVFKVVARLKGRISFIDLSPFWKRISYQIIATSWSNKADHFLLLFLLFIYNLRDVFSHKFGQLAKPFSPWHQALSCLPTFPASRCLPPDSASLWPGELCGCTEGHRASSYFSQSGNKNHKIKEIFFLLYTDHNFKREEVVEGGSATLE